MGAAVRFFVVTVFVAVAALPRSEPMKISATWMATPNITEVERFLGSGGTSAPAPAPSRPRPGSGGPGRSVRLRRHQRIRPSGGSTRSRPSPVHRPFASGTDDPTPPRNSTVADRLHVPLTAIGERLSSGAATILFRGLNNVCSNTGDWRHWLPIYLHRFTGAPVMIWNTLDSNRCRYCPRTVEHSSTRSCPVALSNADVGMLVVVGAGKYRRNFDTSRCEAVRLDGAGESGNAAADCLGRFPYVQRALRSPWISESTHTVHVPISTLGVLNAANVFGFHRIIGDEAFLKPVGKEVAERLRPCMSKRKDNTLLYLARYRPTKGLVRFLQGIDPSLLQGFTVHVYGEVDSARVKGKAQAVAKLRRLPVVFHGDMPKPKLMTELCSASGLIHYAVQDKNPRVAYEALYAGAPIFVTNSSRLPAEVTQQPFVKVTHLSDTEALNRDFREFRDTMVAKREALLPAITDFLQGALNPDTVYRKICRDMGVCA